MKNYAEMVEFVKSLGWKKSGDWANRDFYTFMGHRNFNLVEHNGCWFISKNDDWYFIEDATDEMIAEFTDIIKEIQYCEKNPDKVTLAEYNKSLSKLKNFYSKYEDYEPVYEEEEFEGVDENDL